MRGQRAEREAPASGHRPGRTLGMRRSSSFFKRELSGSYRFAIAVALALALVRCDRATLAWSAVQLVRSLCPTRLPALALDAEEWCWQRWADTPDHASDARGAPPPVLQLTPEQFASMDSLPLDRPWVVRAMLNHTAGGGLRLGWDRRWLSKSPGRGDQFVDYFSDARRELIVPDARAPLREVLVNISAGGPQKLGTEMVFRAEREAVADLAGLGLTSKLGAHYFRPAMLGTVLTMPLFVARGFAAETTRTDLHCEPIANAVLQLEGSKVWTLLAPEHSHLVRPQVSPDGRAFFFTRLEHSAPQFATLPLQRVLTRAGDVLFVPTWTWHRVDYLDQVVSVSVSLFHFRPLDFVWNHPLYAALIVPNLVKEALGLKKQ